MLTYEDRRIFYGIRDLVDRGVATPDEARAGWKPATPVEALPPSPRLTAMEFKRKGIGRQESWSRWVQRTSLHPGMDAKDWYKIYDEA